MTHEVTGKLAEQTSQLKAGKKPQQREEGPTQSESKMNLVTCVREGAGGTEKGKKQISQQQPRQWEDSSLYYLPLNVKRPNFPQFLKPGLKA